MQPEIIPFYYGTPSENQTHRIQQIVLQREKELAQIDSNIIRVRTLLQQLLHDRNDIRESLEAHKALIIPPLIPASQRVPPEIWAQIFAASVDDAWTPEYPQIDVNKPPLLLGRICSSWRTISLNTPELWSSIYIPRRTRATAIPLIEAWLQRSGAMPLFIEINSLSSDFPSAVLDVFIPYSGRWRNLALYMSNTTLAGLFAKTTLPSLDTLMLRVSGRPQQLTIPSSAKQLRSIALVMSRGIRPKPHIFVFPWSQLSYISVTSLSGSIDDSWDILSHCSALTYCSLFAAASTSSPRTSPPLCLPHLSMLQLTTNLDPGPFLDSLILPCLVELEIDFIDIRDEPNTWPKLPIITLVARSSCQLRSFTLRNKSVSEPDLVECCRRIPSLQHLLITGNGEKCVPVRTLELLRSCGCEEGTGRQNVIN
jgi:F-box-like